MARPLRIEYPGAVYHVMNRGLARQPVFGNPTDYETFLQILSETHALWGVEVVPSEQSTLFLTVFLNLLI